MQDQTGHVTVAPEVIIEIVRQTTLATPGVARLDALHPRRVNRWFSENASEGITLDVTDDSVTIDLYVIANPEAQMLELGRALQREIARAIQDGLGMPVKEVNVHIEDVEDRFAPAG